MLIAGANRLWMIYLGRFLSGVSNGTMFSLLVVYISEISHMEIRGANSQTKAVFFCQKLISNFFPALFSLFPGSLVNTVNVIQNVGFVTVYVLGAFLPWRTACWVMVGPNLVSLLLTIFFVPETPYYLISINKGEEARKVLQKLRYLHRKIWLQYWPDTHFMHSILHDYFYPVKW